MLKVKQILVVIVMVVIWATTLIIVSNATTFKGRASIVATGIIINIVLGIYYSCLRQRPVSFRQWLRM